MNKYLERQQILCIGCTAFPLRDEIGCKSCKLGGFEFESHEDYEQRLVRIIGWLANNCTNGEADKAIKAAFNTAKKEEKNGKPV